MEDKTLKSKLIRYIDAGFPIIFINTFEEDKVDDIIREIHAGNMQGNETYPYKIKKKLMEESDGRIMISLSTYKYTEEEAAKAVEAFEKRFENPVKL